MIYRNGWVSDLRRKLELQRKWAQVVEAREIVCYNETDKIERGEQ